MALAAVSAGTIIHQACLDLCEIQPGGAESANIDNEGLNELNQLVDQWQLRRLMAPFNRIDTYNLVASQYIYQIGPTATDFVTTKPLRIDYANLLLSNVTPVVRLPMTIITRMQWMRIPIPALNPGAIPSELYYETGTEGGGATSQNGTIRIWPPPIYTYQMELMTPQQLQQFADLTTTYVFPPGYQRALRKNLAVAMRPMLTDFIKTMKGGNGKMKDSAFPLVQADARRALIDIESYNSRPEVVAAAPEYLQNSDGGWNYLSDQFESSSSR